MSPEAQIMQQLQDDQGCKSADVVLVISNAARFIPVPELPVAHQSREPFELLTAQTGC